MKTLKKRLSTICIALASVITPTSFEAANSMKASAAVNVVNGGVYILESALASNKVVDVSGGHINTDETDIWLYERNDSAAQKLQITDVGGGYYKIRVAAANNMVLDVWGGAGYPCSGTNVQLYHDKNDFSDNQLWSIEDAGNNYVNIVSKCGFYLDTCGYSSNMTSLKVNDKNMSYSQQFKLIPCGSNNVPAYPTNTCSPDAVIKVAEAEVGYMEKASNAYLDDKTANAGANDFNKYARDFDKYYPNFYNTPKNGFAWCDVFVDWCFLKAYGEDKALSLLCQKKASDDVEWSYGAAPKHSLKYYEKKGQFYTNSPKPGDQIFFLNSVGYHTGIVYSVDASKVYTIEGNCGQQVRKMSYSLNDGTILGYGRPAYDAVAAGSNESNISDSDSGNTLPDTPYEDTPAPTVESNTYFPACGAGYTSIVEALKSIGVDSSYNYRAQIAAANGIQGYSGTSSQNIRLLELLANGTLKVPMEASADVNVVISSEVQPSIPQTDTPFLVRVTISNLRIRKGPGTNYASAGYTGAGTFTIVEVTSGAGSNSGWGRLKSGAGWISLDYASRV